MTLDFRPGDVLKYNTLWKLGQHYSFDFFKISHITPKNNIMGWRLSSTRTNETFDFDAKVDFWTVDINGANKKLFRLPHPELWDVMTEEEILNGIRRTSCVA